MASVIGWLLFGMPVVAAALALLASEKTRARTIAVVAAVIEVALTVFALGAGPGEAAITEPGAMLELDGIARVLLLVSVISTVGAIVGSPKGPTTQRGYAASLLMLGGAAVLHCARGLDTFVVMWLVSLLPGYLYLDDRRGDGRRVRRIYTTYLLAGAVPLIVASLILHAVTVRPAGEPLLLSNSGAWVPPAYQGIVCGLLAVTAMARAAIFPLHGWLPVVMDHAPTLGWQLVGFRASTLLMVRIVMPLMTGAADFLLPLLAAAGLLGAVYASLVALAQTELKRLVGYVSVSQSSLIFVGLASMNEQSVSGALLWCVAFPVSMAGMLLVAGALRARLGVSSFARLGGLVERAPLMTAFFLLFALASSAAPGTLGFVAEDLLIHGMLETQPWLATLMLVAAALNAVALFRGFSSVFVGRHRGRSRTEGPPQMLDLLPRERGVALALAVMLLATGISPRSILVVNEPEVQRVLARAPAAAHAELGDERARVRYVSP